MAKNDTIDTQVLEKLEILEKDAKPLELKNYKLDYIQISPLPFVEKSLDSDSFMSALKDKKVKEIFSFDYNEITGLDTAKETYGKLDINDETVYFALIDNEGYSGYDCCGYIKLEYCYSLQSLVQLGMDSIQKNNLLNEEKLQQEYHESQKSINHTTTRLQAFA